MATDASTERKTSTNLPHLAGRVFDTPLLMTREKVDVILSALAPRLGIAPPLAVFDFEEAERHDFAVVNGVAMISVVGTLVARGSGMDAMSGMTSYGQIAQDLDRALADPAVEAILLDLDSPGGECSGCFELAAKIRAAHAVKPIAAVAGPMACSAAYALAAAAGRVLVPEVGYLGSVGVITVHCDQSKRDEQMGVVYTSIYAGDRKNDGDPHHPLSDEARASIQERIDHIYGVFVESVAKHRGLDQGAVRATQAGLFVGAKAVEAGFADAIGGHDEAIAALKAEVMERRMTKQLAEQVRSLTLERDAARAKLAGLETEVASLRAAAETRRKADVGAFLEHLRADSAAAGAPIAEVDVSEVEGLFAAGKDDLAKRLGGTLLRVAAAQGGGSFVRKPGPSAEDERLAHRRSQIKAEAELLTRAGHIVELSEDGLEIKNWRKA